MILGLSIRRYLLCTDCFAEHGLKASARRFGFTSRARCRNCGSSSGLKLGWNDLHALVKDFFVDGTFWRSTYGGSPLVQYNEHQKTDVNFGDRLNSDAALLGKTLGIGFFHYGPRMWMIGEIEPLLELQSPDTRNQIIDRILSTYPTAELESGSFIYRLRIDADKPACPKEFDAPPEAFCGKGRFDSKDFPVLYASQDIEVCIHECRASANDVIHVATLVPTRKLKLLDLSAIIDEGRDVSDFERLDLAINMLSLAGPHSYEISRSIAKRTKDAGYDGIIFSSYFSLLRTGGLPNETVYGLPYRRFPDARKYEEGKIVRNIAVFGRPLLTGVLRVECINGLFLRHAKYDFRLGPAQIE